MAEVLDAAKRHIGELAMEIALLRERARAAEQRLPLAIAEVATMSATTSAATGRCFGIQRVCQIVWEPLALGALRAAGAGTPPAGRGAGAAGAAAEAIGRAALAAIRPISRGPRSTAKAIARSTPRLRILDGIRVARTRVLRVMPGHTDCSPRTAGVRAPRRPRTTDLRVITQAPNVMWGTDGVRVFTLDDGWGWIFAAVEHWNAECVGWPPCAKSGVASRHSIRLRTGSNVSMVRWTPRSPSRWRFGWTTAVSICQTTSSSRSGIGGSTPVSALSSVAERWNRGSSRNDPRPNLSEPRGRPRRRFVERYNQTWRLEKLGYHTPIEAREEYVLRQAA